MNQQDRDGFNALSQQIKDLTNKVEALSYLSDEGTIEAIKQLTEPKTVKVLGELAEGYKGARWFTGVVKWLGGFAAAILGIWAFIEFAIGDRFSGG